MTAIVVGVNPARALKRRSEHAEEFLQEYGFERGQHFASDLEAVTLATKVQIDLEIRAERSEEGFLSFKVECERKCSNCRGWDGSAKYCECGAHWVVVQPIGNYPSASYRIECVCCHDCGSVGGSYCRGCKRFVCDRCKREHDDDDC